MPTYVFHLPFGAPSTNGAYTNHPKLGRILTRKGRDFLNETHLALTAQMLYERWPSAPTDLPLRVTYVFHMTGLITKGWPKQAQNRYKRVDLSNRIKLVEDAVMRALGCDDAQVFELHLRKVPSEEDTIDITVEIMEEHEVGTLGAQLDGAPATGSKRPAGVGRS
jgi:Holliday junction resolvase RusA-like endonuclease